MTKSLANHAKCLMRNIHRNKKRKGDKMTLTKAIEIMELNVKEAGSIMPPDTLEALKLHIEAAKHFKDRRVLGCREVDFLLPGETETDNPRQIYHVPKVNARVPRLRKGG